MHVKAWQQAEQARRQAGDGWRLDSKPMADYVAELQVPLAGFEDVTPIPQDDGPDSVVSIAYKHNCEWTLPKNSNYCCSS